MKDNEENDAAVGRIGARLPDDWPLVFFVIE